MLSATELQGGLLRCNNPTSKTETQRRSTMTESRGSNPTRCRCASSLALWTAYIVAILLALGRSADGVDVKLHLRPVHVGQLLARLMSQPGGLLHGLGHAGGPHFTRAPNGDVVASVPLPALPSSVQHEGDAKGEVAESDQRTVAAALFNGGRGLRVHATSSRSRAVIVLRLPEEAVAVRSAELAPGHTATVVLVPRPGAGTAFLPPTGADVLLPAARGVDGLGTGGSEKDVGSGGVYWAAGPMLVVVAFVALALMAKRRYDGVDKDAVNREGNGSGLSQVLSQRFAEDRGDGKAGTGGGRKGGSVEKSSEKVN